RGRTVVYAGVTNYLTFNLHARRIGVTAHEGKVLLHGYVRSRQSREGPGPAGVGGAGSQRTGKPPGVVPQGIEMAVIGPHGPVHAGGSRGCGPSGASLS